MKKKKRVTYIGEKYKKKWRIDIEACVVNVINSVRHFFPRCYQRWKLIGCWKKKIDFGILSAVQRRRVWTTGRAVAYSSVNTVV